MAESSPSKKTTKKKSDQDPSTLSPKKSSKSKIPRSFIARPSPNYSNKSLARVYLNASTLKAIEIDSGSFVYLVKESEATGVLATVAAGDEGCASNVIQLSHSLRSISGIVLGDRLEVSKAIIQPSYGLSVSIGTEDGKELSNRAIKSVEKLLDEVGIIMPGMRFPKFRAPGENEGEGKTEKTLIVVSVDEVPDLSSLNLETSDNSSQRFVSPPILFKRGETDVRFTTEKGPDRKYGLPVPTTYSSVGGLASQIELLKSTIELPLHQPTLFSDFGITPPRGILLHGPPGTGKTMLLRAVASETNAHVLTINGPSIVSKYVGETESTLRDIFIEARKYEPAIIFMDEVDSLAPSRESDESGRSDNRVVATLLTLMDGVGDSGRLVVVGATNRPNAIDPALRRPGRFDQEVEIGIPDLEARHEILKLQFEKMKRHVLTENDVLQVASKTHGYVGADLVALCRESAMKAIQNGLKSGIPRSDMRVTIEDVDSAQLEVRPSAMREIFLETPQVHWDDIGGQEQLKSQLKEMIELPLQSSETFKRLGVSAPKGILLYGPPGCSKTLTAKALATESGVNFLAVKGPEIFNKYVGESEKAIREIFRKARAAAPSIIFFDEIDALSTNRAQGRNTTQASAHVLTSLLNEIDGVEELRGVVIVAATNRPTDIDSALLRPGRLDRHVYVGPPDLKARMQILCKRTSSMAILEGDVDLNGLAERTEGCSGAEVVLLCQEAGLAAIMENPDATNVESRHFEKALGTISKGITPEMVQYYQEFASKSAAKTGL